MQPTGSTLHGALPRLKGSLGKTDCLEGRLFPCFFTTSVNSCDRYVPPGPGVVQRYELFDLARLMLFLSMAKRESRMGIRPGEEKSGCERHYMRTIEFLPQRKEVMP